MAIDNFEDDSRRRVYTAAPGQVVFTYPFHITAATDLKVAVDGVLLPGTAYSVAGVGSPTGSTFVVSPAMVGGERVVVYSDTPVARQTDWNQNGTWAAERVNDELDFLTKLLQEVEMRERRSFRSSEIDDAIPAMPLAAERAGKYLKCDSAGRPSFVDGPIPENTLDNLPNLSHTVDTALTAVDIADYWNNNFGATGNVTLTLPAAVDGSYGQVIAMVPDVVLSLLPASGERWDGLSANEPLDIVNTGYVLFRCDENGVWRVVSSSAVTNKFFENEQFTSGFVNVKDPKYGAVGDGVADDTAAIQAAHNDAASMVPVGVVYIPFGDYRTTSTITLKASMTGPSGNGYSSAMGRARFRTEITGNLPAFKGDGRMDGVDLRHFSIEPNISSPNPNPSGGNVQACIGIQMGQCPVIIASIAKTTTTTVTVTTKWPHTFAVGNTLKFDNIVGMTNLNSGGTGSAVGTDVYTVSAVNYGSKTFTVGTANNSGWTAHTANTGISYTSDLGSGTAFTRGVIEDVTISSCAVNFHICGWLNRLSGLKSNNGTLAFDGGYLNSCVLDLIVENSWQAFQLLGCNALSITRYQEEGGGTNDLGSPSTIDYCEHVFCAQVAGEGSRRATGGAWMSWGGVSFCRDIHFPHGFLYAGGSSGVSLAVGNVSGYSVPERCIGGVSRTGSSLGYNGTAAFSAGTTVAVTLPGHMGTDYRVGLTPLADPVGRLWVTGKTTNGFTINNSSSTSISVDWHVVR